VVCAAAPSRPERIEHVRHGRIARISFPKPWLRWLHLAVGLFDIMVRKGIMTVEEARATIQDWSERSARLEGTANHDAATVLSGLAKYFNVNTLSKVECRGRVKSLAAVGGRVLIRN
jgi:hypothetical protein